MIVWRNLELPLASTHLMSLLLLFPSLWQRQEQKPQVLFSRSHSSFQAHELQSQAAPPPDWRAGCVIFSLTYKNISGATCVHKCHIRYLSCKVRDTGHLMEHHCSWKGGICAFKKLIIFSSDNAKISWWQWPGTECDKQVPLSSLLKGCSILSYQVILLKMHVITSTDPEFSLNAMKDGKVPPYRNPSRRTELLGDGEWISRCGWLLQLPQPAIPRVAELVCRASTTLAPHPGHGDMLFLQVQYHQHTVKPRRVLRNLSNNVKP